MNYLQFSFTIEPIEPGADILIAELAELNFDSFEQSEKGVNAYILKETFIESELQKVIDSMKENFKISYTSEEIEQQNWNAIWESNFELINVDNMCVVRAPFHEKVENVKYDIIIEPKMSFGTGHHPTTQLMIKKLLELDVKGSEVLDMGCGTGVLAVLASKMGASKVVAIDIDEWSYENTLENVDRNKMSNIDVFKGNSQILDKKTFNTILANINKNVLINDMHIYAESLENKGNLILSGFFETDVKELIDKAKSLSLSYFDKLTDNQWVVLHFKN